MVPAIVSTKGPIPDSAATLETLLSQVADKPLMMARLAHLLNTKGQGERARELCTRAIAMAPNDGELRALTAEVFSNSVATWYFPMVHDHGRHAAYEAAMRRAIRPSYHVLEIGTGTGLLAMMAARAGAAEVTSCENNPVVAAAARDIIVHNGFADRVRVIVKDVADLEVGADLSDQADVLVWDVLGSNMIGAGALPAVETAVRRLTRAGAPVIPAHGTLRVALAEDRQAHLRRMQVIEGFDLSAFNRLAAPTYTILVGDERLVLRSEPEDLFCFDFQSGGPFPEARSTTSLTATGGCVNGIVQWIRFNMDGETCYENLPSEGSISTFGAVFHPIAQPLEMMPGTRMTVSGAHDRSSLRIWADASVD